MQFGSWNDEGPCSSKNTIEELLNCEKCKGEFEKFYLYLKSDMNKLIDDLKTYVNNNKKKVGDW